jgi:hypothetical protein
MFIDTQERPAGEVQQKVGKLKLSEAIRIGAKIRPQCEGAFFRDGRSCAMGAAMEGSGLSYDPARAASPAAVARFPELFFTGTHYTNLGREIFMRNDCHESRESIATWLEQQGL